MAPRVKAIALGVLTASLVLGAGDLAFAPPPRERRPLRLRPGMKVEFPVSEQDPLAVHQRMRMVESFDDIKDFAFVRLWMQRERRPSEAEMVEWVKRLDRPIFELQLADFIVPVGTTVVMNNALNRIDANKVRIGGKLEVHGDLAIVAKEIRGGSGEVDACASKAADGVDSSGSPAPAKPGKAPKGNDGGGFSGAQVGSTGVNGAKGTNGGAGANGFSGSTISVDVITYGPNLTFCANGQDGGRGGSGGPGGDGGDGGDGGNGHWFSGGANGGTGGNGGNGGDGGKGGDGGEPGALTVLYKFDASAGTTISLVAGGAGGPGGVGGTGGQAGQGGQGGEGGWASFGASGSNGTAGVPGSNGVNGASGNSKQAKTGVKSFIQKP